MFKGGKYCLNSLGFGLNVAPLVMTTVLNHVLSLDPVVRKGTSAYIDNIFINEDVVEARRAALGKPRVEDPPEEERADGPYQVGDNLWLRPPGTRCDTQYRKGTVTKIISEQAVEVGGIPNHVRDVCHRTTSVHLTSQGGADRRPTRGPIIMLPTRTDVGWEGRQSSSAVAPAPVATLPSAEVDVPQREIDEDTSAPQISEQTTVRRSARVLPMPVL
ncbi:hypothetical protein D918_09544 [Trichuris suis]|nr:hypothetical protein D918_09544 [Trichuris suis]